jgi:hypothetical protein
VNAAIDVALGGKMDDCSRPVLTQKPIDEGPVANVTTNESVARVSVQTAEVRQVARVSEGVNIDYRLAAVGQPVKNEVAPNESCAASY